MYNVQLADIILVPVGSKAEDGFYEGTRAAKVIKLLPTPGHFKIRFLNNEFEEYGSENGVKRNSNDVIKNFGFQSDKNKISKLISFFKYEYHLNKKRVRLGSDSKQKNWDDWRLPNGA